LTAGELITAVIDGHVNPGGNQSADAALRARKVRDLQSIGHRFESFRPWPFAFRSWVIDVLGGDEAGAIYPAAQFGSPGPKLRVYLYGSKRELQYVEPERLFHRRAMSPSSGTPTFYTFSGVDPNGLREVSVYPTPSTDIQLLLDNFRRLRPIIVDRPGECTLTTAADGPLNGTYRYRLTFVNSEGGETEGGVISGPIDVLAGNVVLTDIPVSTASRIVTVRIYREVNGSAVWEFVAEIPNGVTTYTDSAPDGTLGDQLHDPLEAVTGLEYFPVQYHDSVFYDAMVQLDMRSQGDARSAAELPPVVMKAFADAWREETIHHVPRRAPRYGRRW